MTLFLSTPNDSLITNEVHRQFTLRPQQDETRFFYELKMPHHVERLDFGSPMWNLNIQRSIWTSPQTLATNAIMLKSSEVWGQALFRMELNSKRTHLPFRSFDFQSLRIRGSWCDSFSINSKGQFDHKWTSRQIYIEATARTGDAFYQGHPSEFQAS